MKVSYVGMKPQVVNVSGKSVINIKLEDDATSLNDVVVIGYGSVKKKDLTGSVATVNSETLAAVPVANASEALTGKMPGVQITTSEGSPDATVKSVYVVVVLSPRAMTHCSLLMVSLLMTSATFLPTKLKILLY